MSGTLQNNKNKPNGVTTTLPCAVLNSYMPVSILFDIFFKRLHPLYSIEYAGLFIYDEELTVIRELFTSTYSLNTEEIVTQSSFKPTALTALQKTVAGFAFPVLKTAGEWLEETSENHAPVNGTANYQYHCYVPLEINNRVAGTLELHNASAQLSTECLAYCCSIADLFADIIQHQQNNPGANATGVAAVQPSALPDVSNVTSLGDLLAVWPGLAASTQDSIHKQIDELKVLANKVDDAVVHTNNTVAKPNYPNIIGAGPAMQRVFGLINQVANSDSTVLILGETGTGKELIAKAIHQNSARAANAMVSVNCAAIPASLIESELFGHEKGAFTGATDKRTGKFEQARNGTLFLDEVCEIPPEIQVKLLRALQENEIERVGGKEVIKCDVRVIAATNRNLLDEVEQGRFRRDLYFRLNVIPITLPTLRERTEDIPLLATYFLNKHAAKSGKQVTAFTKGAIKQLRSYSWPGNVREMGHLIERHVLLSQKPVINIIDLPTAQSVMPDKRGSQKKIKTIDENERDHIFEVLQLCNGRVSGQYGAAKLLGVPATTLNSKMKKLGINKKHF